MNPVGFVGWGTTWFESFGYRAKPCLTRRSVTKCLVTDTGQPPPPLLGILLEDAGHSNDRRNDGQRYCSAGRVREAEGCLNLRNEGEGGEQPCQRRDG